MSKGLFILNKRNRLAVTFRQKIILILLGLFLTFAILETGLRLGGMIILALQERRNLLAIRQKGEYRIVCFGESTTQRQYPHYLEEILNQQEIGLKFSVIDKGVAGRDTEFIVSQVESVLDKYQPDLVVTMMGVNDYAIHMPHEAPSGSKLIRLFRSLKTYKLIRLIQLHLDTKKEKRSSKEKSRLKKNA